MQLGRKVQNTDIEKGPAGHSWGHNIALRSESLYFESIVNLFDIMFLEPDDQESYINSLSQKL